jgi:thiamine-phosphate pyrophosphorylase
VTVEATCRLYLITPPQLDAAAFSLTLAQALEAGDIAAVQLRLKGVSDDEIRASTRVLKPIVQRHGAAFILNDRPDLAAELGCDGVHIGQSDATYDEARRLMGEDRIVGVTCHNSRHLAIEAAEAGADYVAFGAFFPSATKAVTAVADLALLRWWADLMTVPCVAIGGITPENCAPLVEAGADFLAVSAGVWQYAAGPAAAVAALTRAIADALPRRPAWIAWPGSI